MTAFVIVFVIEKPNNTLYITVITKLNNSKKVLRLNTWLLFLVSNIENSDKQNIRKFSQVKTGKSNKLTLDKASENGSMKIYNNIKCFFMPAFFIPIC